MGWHWSLGAAGSWARWRLVAADRCSTHPAVDRSSKSASPPSQVCPSLLSVLLLYRHDTDSYIQIDRSIDVYTTWVTHLAKKVNRAWCVSVPWQHDCACVDSSSPVGANCVLCCRMKKEKAFVLFGLMSCCIVSLSCAPHCVVVNALHQDNTVLLCSALIKHGRKAAF